MSPRSNPPPPAPHSAVHRLRVAVRGAVQGVGFRPFVYRLATELHLTGWVNNTPQGVFLEVEGPRDTLEAFLLRLHREKPPRASIQGLESTWLDPVGFTRFEIRESDTGGAKTALVLPDIALCPDCLADILDPDNRRYRYPFTNCTNCGPRYTIIRSLPYDRPNTTMAGFAMCEDCRREYDDPLDRRFHAQPNACPHCGPHLELWDAAIANDADPDRSAGADRVLDDTRTGTVLASRDDALLAAAAALREGRIVAVKGLGGFHLLVDARNDAAVRRLRDRKHREEKPFALMVPDLAAAKALCEVSPIEERLLLSPEAPIVLLRRRSVTAGDSAGSVGSVGSVGVAAGADVSFVVAPSVAPGNPTLGLMLPYTPLHVLLLRELGFPVVATSGNLSDEPICTDETDAATRLAGIADLFLVHNRPIARHVDDSVTRVVMDRELVLRRGRGYAPMPIGMVGDGESLLAVGGHLKNSVALSVGGQVFGSQHIGDLETAEAYEAFERVIGDLERLYEARPVRVACDLHPDYLSSHYARRLGLPVVPVQHHVAHILSCMAENELEGRVFGISWDGTGYGLDGSLWGGEFFDTGKASFRRAAHLRSFRLPGAEKAIKEPRRGAIGLLFEIEGSRLFSRRDLACLLEVTEEEKGVLRTLLERGLNAPLTTSAGRLFDAVASLAGVRQRVGYEGQAAMELEFARDGSATDEAYPFRVVGEGGDRPLVVDWEPMVWDLLEDVKCGASTGRISSRFHNMMAEAIVEIARRTGVERVVLSGGCFQNACLTERAVRRLREEGFRPYWHQRVPPNDGGLALGQLAAAARKGTQVGPCV